MTLAWPYYAGACGVAIGVALLMARGEPIGVWSPPPEPPPPAPRGVLKLGEAVTVHPGRTYFVAVEANGAVAAAATLERIKRAAEGYGFRDVVAVEDEPLPNWPIAAHEDGDYFVRLTYGGEQSRAFPRKVSVFMGSAILLDVHEV
ncbi:MAG: hypothetical protein WKG32_20955 [Gemmatimonadaceae bacterium]